MIAGSCERFSDGNRYVLIPLTLSVIELFLWLEIGDETVLLSDKILRTLLPVVSTEKKWLLSIRAQ